MTARETVPSARAVRACLRVVGAAVGLTVVLVLTSFVGWLLRRKDGTKFPVEVSAKLLPDRLWQAIVRDITDRKRLERELRGREADLNRAQAIAHVGSWSLDVERNVLLWSDETHRLFGMTKAEPRTYETFLSRVHPDDRESVDRKWKAACRGEPYDIEHRILVEGDVRWVRERAALEFREDGTLLRGVGSTEDITERKAAQAALERAHAAERELRARLERLSAASVAVSGAVAATADDGIDAVLRDDRPRGEVRDPRGLRRHRPRVRFRAARSTPGSRTGRPTGAKCSPVGCPSPSWEPSRAVARFASPTRPPTSCSAGPCRSPRRSGRFSVRPSASGAGLSATSTSRGPGARTSSRRRTEIVVEMLAAHAGTELRTAQLYEREAHERARLEAFLEHMPAGVIVADAAGNTVRNEAMRALSSATGELDPLGQSVTVDLCTPGGERLPIDEHPIVGALRRGEETRTRELVARVGGVEVPVLVSGAPIRDARSREIVGAVATFQEHHRAQASREDARGVDLDHRS